MKRIKLKKRREELGLTQEDVAVQAKINRASYANIENGKRNPSLLLATIIAEILKTDINIFFEYDVSIRHERAV
jgi:putative transcriptional regulator